MSRFGEDLLQSPVHCNCLGGQRVPDLSILVRHGVAVVTGMAEKYLIVGMAVPLLASARNQRVALTLSTFTYTIQYKAGKDHAKANGLSRLPLEYAPTEVPKL